MQMLSTKSIANATLTRCLAPLLLTLAFALIGAGCSGGGSNEDNGGGLEAPASPTGLEATSQDGAISLDWDAVGGADTYRLYRSTSSGTGTSGNPQDTGIGPTDYVDDTAENGTTYYYVVTAVANEGGESAESDPSNEVEKTPFSDPPDRP